MTPSHERRGARRVANASRSGALGVLAAIALLVSATLLPNTAEAVPGVTTTNVNFRTGPSTEFQSQGVLPGGTPVEIVDCEAGGTWCSVIVDGQDGFISGNYLNEVAVAIDEPPGTDIVEPTGDIVGADGPLLSEAELDELVAPIALYPDNLVAQVLVAATVPVDVIKAERWVEENAELPAEERAEAANGEDWDESVAMLAAAFPTVINMMAEDIDWTEDLGEAMLAQSDDVLDAVQRQRARAQAVGNLETNEAQTVEVVDNSIVIEPTGPETVYVPAYNPQTVYTTPAPAQPVYVSTADDGWDTGAAVATGAIAFGTGLALGSVFNNDYRDYWYGPPPVYWDQRRFYPRPGVRPPYRPGWGKRPGRPPRPGRPGRPNVDVNVGGGNINIGSGNINVGNRPGSNNTGAWRPDSRRKQQARRNIERRKGGDGLKRPGARRPAAANRPASGRPNRGSVEQRLNARSPGQRKVAKPAAGQRKPAARKASAKPKALSKPRGKSAAKARKSANRGKASGAKRNANRPAQRKARKVHKPQRAQARAPARRAAPKRTAMRKNSARRAQASRSRGGRRGGRRRR